MAGRSLLVNVLLLLTLCVVSLLGPAATASAAPDPGPQAVPLDGKVEGALTGNPGGSFVYYAFSYAGDGSPVQINFDVWSADQSAVRAAGLNVYGPAAGKLYANAAPQSGPASLTASFASSEPGTYLAQVFNYSPVAIGYALSSNQKPAAAVARGGHTIVLDPGHGGLEIGSASPQGDLVEKQINLRIALKLADLLRADGNNVILTRDSDRAVNPAYRSSKQDVSMDLQARVDIANAANADLFICIHNNGGPAAQSGTEVWFNRGRPFSDRNQTLAQLVQANLLSQIRALGYPVRDRGLKPDDNFRVVGGRSYNIYVLAPGTPPVAHTPTKMPAILGESLFLSNPQDAEMLRQERTLDAIARGYRDAVVAYFQKYS